eukprot:jgi/Tetstr1/428024/TSEL_000169.t1
MTRSAEPAAWTGLGRPSPVRLAARPSTDAGPRFSRASTVWVTVPAGAVVAVGARGVAMPRVQSPTPAPAVCEGVGGFLKGAEGGADAAADGVPPAVVDAHRRRAAKLTAVQELRRARRQAQDTADLGMVSDAAAALPVLEALHPPHAPTDPEHVDLWRWEHIRDMDVPSWRLWVNRCLAGLCHSRTAVFFASGTVFALHKEDPAAREERAKTGEPLRVRPLGVGSVFRVCA